MSRCPCALPSRAVLWAFASLLVPMLAAVAAPAPDGPQIGSPNPATADPPVPRPAGRPCVVHLFTDLSFADFSPKAFAYAPPAGCPAPWSRVILAGDFSVTAGRQFDRTANIWIGGVNVYFGTTAEPSRTVSPAWHVERDLTDYTALFSAARPGRVDLGNLVDATYTGVIHGSADLLFYPAERRDQPPRTPDVVLPLSADPTGGTVALSASSAALARSFTLPPNVERAYLDVFVQSQSADEFWYTCAPSDVAGLVSSCPGTGFREAEIAIDGQPAGVAPVFPWIYTGGIDPYLWRPIPGIQTLNFDPYRVDLSPFAGLLSDGRPHEVAVRVYNADNYFSATATLLLYQDRGAARVSGALLKNTLSADPAPAVKEHLSTINGVTSGTVAVRAARQFTIAGYVRTSHGVVETEVAQEVAFSNEQRYDISASVYTQDITQRTDLLSVVTVRDGERRRTSFHKREYPLRVHYSQTTNPDGSGSQTTQIRQGYQSDEILSADGVPAYSRFVTSAVAPADTLLFDSSGALTGTQGQRSTDEFSLQDSRGACYSRRLTAADGVLTAITDGKCWPQ